MKMYCCIQIQIRYIDAAMHQVGTNACTILNLRIRAVTNSEETVLSLVANK